MAVEKARGCGYRKVGGLYLVCDAPGRACCKLPFELHVCPTCNGGIKQSRGWQWIDPKPWLKGPCKLSGHCPAANPFDLGERVGLLWIGAEFYPTPESFMAEASRQGISRRIKVVPREFELGRTWVMLAHPRLKPISRDATGAPREWFEPDVTREWIGGVFHLMRPTRVEKIVTDVEAKDAAAMAALAEADITPVVVPASDPDHAPRGDKVADEAEPELV